MELTSHFSQGKPALHYRTGGEGPAVVFIHGYGEDNKIWDTILPSFESHQVFLFDLPGFGKSEVWKGYELSDLANAYLEVIDSSGIGEFSAFGHSMGGYTTCEFIATIPDRLRSTGLIHSHPFGDSDETKAARLEKIKHLEEYGPNGYLKAFIRILYSPTFVEENTELVNQMYEQALTFPTNAYIQALHAMHGRANRSAAISKFEKPILFMVGTEDLAVPMKESMEQLSLAPAAQVELLDGIGHSSMLECPEVARAIFKEFLDFTEKFYSK